MDLFFQEYGQGEKTLIILHGLLGTSDNWHSLSARYGTQFRVIAPDLANHGRSPHARIFSYDSMMDGVLELMDKLQLQKANFIGHSMGGKVAMRMALDHPERVEKLIISDIAPRMYSRGHDAIFDAMFKLPLNEIQSRKEADDFLKLLIPNDGVRLFILKNLSRDTHTGQYFWRPNLEILFEQYDEIRVAFTAGNFGGPTLFIQGGNSDYITPADHSQILKLFPKAQFAIIPNAGHWIHADQPELFYQETIEFLNN